MRTGIVARVFQQYSRAAYRRARSLLAAVAVLLAIAGGLGCTGPAPLAPRPPTPGAVHFSVVTYNVHADRASDAHTVEAVGAADGDIVCLQEVTPDWERALRARYADLYPHMLFWPHPKTSGLAILSRFPLEDRGVVSISGDFHPAWMVEAATPGGHVQVLNVHLRALFNGDRDWISNYLSTAEDHVFELRQYLSPRSAELPLIVAGDFNESPKGAAVRLLEREGFQNALPLFHPGQFTWKGRSVARALELTIDHVMFDPSFEPLDAYILRVGSSDHFPVVARLELRADNRAEAALPAR